MSVDVSSTSPCSRRTAPSAALDLIAVLRPAVVFANGDEAKLLGIARPLSGAVTFVKHGAADAVVHVPGDATHVVPAIGVGPVLDTTGAGDAFAAGVLTSDVWRTDPVAACAAGHRAAAALLSSRVRQPAPAAR